MLDMIIVLAPLHGLAVDALCVASRVGGGAVGTVAPHA